MNLITESQIEFLYSLGFKRVRIYNITLDSFFKSETHEIKISCCSFSGDYNYIITSLDKTFSFNFISFEEMYKHYLSNNYMISCRKNKFKKINI